MMKDKTLAFPWGRIGVNLAILFWLVAFVTGVVGSHDVRQAGISALLIIALLAGSIVCGGIGLSKPGLQNKLVAGVALALTIVPIALIIAKS